MKKIGVLASGEGTNLQAIWDAVGRGEVAGEIAVVLSDRLHSGALKRARSHGIKAVFLDRRSYSCREKFDEAIKWELLQEKVELVVLAGFMRLLSPVLTGAFAGRIMNVHPSLLPAFPGLDGVQQALEHGVKYTGCTVHFVDEGLDTGPIILQEPVPVLQADTLDTLHQRIHAAEYRSYPRAIDLFCRGKLKLEGRKCFIFDSEEDGLS